jgi:hypothetical protein
LLLIKFVIRMGSRDMAISSVGVLGNISRIVKGVRRSYSFLDRSLACVLL